MALEDVSAHRGGTDPIEGLIRIETSPQEQATPIIMEMICRGSVDSGVTAATWTAALTRPDGVGEDAEISPAPVLITEHEVVFGRAAALPRPNEAARAAAAAHDIRTQAARIEAILSRAAAGPRA